MNITQCILFLIPDAKFVCWENDYKRIIWNSERPMPTLQELESVLLPVVIAQKKQEIKSEASRRIEETLSDWNARRHRDQIELGVTTTLTAADYATKQQKCQSIRDASNTIESEIQSLNDPAAIENFDVANHPAWPV